MCLFSSGYYDNMICSANNHPRSTYVDTIKRRKLIYPDAPKSSRILNKKRSIFSLPEANKLNEVIYKEDLGESMQSKPIKIKKSISSTRHIGCQTDYREESTQTDPFSPIYTISDNQHPEVLALSDLTYGKGLPVSSIEISIIERLRSRHQWEQNHAIDMTRTKIIIEREIHEWQLREKEIQMLQELRHEIFTKNLHTYVETDENFTQNLIDLWLYRLEKQLNLQHKRLENDTARDIRRIKRIYRLREAQINAVTNCNHLGIIGMTQNENGCICNLKPPWHTRSDDIITTFKNRTPKMSIPCASFEYLIDRRLKQSGINIFKLEESLPKDALIPQIDEPNRLKIFEDKHNRKLSRHIRDLEKAYQLIQDEKTKRFSVPTKKPLRFVEKIETIDHNQQLPSISTQTETHDPRRITLIKLQNYLRSINVQSKIANIRDMRQDLLDELKNGLKSEQISSLDSSDHTYRPEVVSPHTQIYDYLEGTIIADMLDFLSKELLRLQCEQTIHLSILLADRYRYQQESIETDTRIRAIEQQKIQEDVFQQMFSFDTNSDIESYLQDLILQSISDTADEQAKLEIKQIAETLASLTNDITKSSTNSSDNETIVSDLVYNYLFPTVQRILSQKQNNSMQ